MMMASPEERSRRSWKERECFWWDTNVTASPGTPPPSLKSVDTPSLCFFLFLAPRRPSVKKPLMVEVMVATLHRRPGGVHVHKHFYHHSIRRPTNPQALPAPNSAQHVSFRGAPNTEPSDTNTPRHRQTRPLTHPPNLTHALQHRGLHDSHATAAHTRRQSRATLTPPYPAHEVARTPTASGVTTTKHQAHARLHVVLAPHTTARRRPPCLNFLKLSVIFQEVSLPQRWSVSSQLKQVPSAGEGPRGTHGSAIQQRGWHMVAAHGSLDTAARWAVF
ncbi:hypothetical protein E2C01_043609 [Portunus trituberculatus]|uniref:Uncharacterized protein n=1 Tax=Portunus trituberculatus TaxID=210409 RepID=A0A5B7FW52_PORTR|nr:hypothetical protein [Portunus trituberculatus]